MQERGQQAGHGVAVGCEPWAGAADIPVEMDHLTDPLSPVRYSPQDSPSV